MLKNDYEIRGNELILFLTRRHQEPLETSVSLRHFDMLSKMNIKWHAAWSEGVRSYYVKGNYTREDGTKTTVSLHRIIMGVTDPRIFVDHIDHNTLRNVDENLRIVLPIQNNHNKRKAINNTSGYRNVYYHKGTGKWTSAVILNGKRYHFGYHDTPEEAHKEVSEFRAKHMPHSLDALDKDVDVYTEDMSDLRIKLEPTSQYVGVYWNRIARKWGATYFYEGKQHFLGYYDDETVASFARDIALFKRFGANLPGRLKFNHPDLFNSNTITWEKVDSDPQLRQLYRRTG